MRSIAKVVGKEQVNSPYKVILYPITSDKNVVRMENENTLTFVVALSANKCLIKKTFEKLLNVKVRSVNTMIRWKQEGLYQTCSEPRHFEGCLQNRNCLI